MADLETEGSIIATSTIEVEAGVLNFYDSDFDSRNEKIAKMGSAYWCFSLSPQFIYTLFDVIRRDSLDFTAIVREFPDALRAKSEVQFVVMFGVNEDIVLDTGFQPFNFNENSFFGFLPFNYQLPPRSVKVHLSVKSTETLQDTESEKMIQEEVKHNCFKLFNDATFTDFKFTVQGKIFNVHKCILSSFSPVMQRMFLGDFKEAIRHTCTITDIEANIFESLIGIAYGIKPKDIVTIAEPLFVAADYYEVDIVKQMCVNHLIEYLSIDNALELYEITYRHEMEELRKASWECIRMKFFKDQEIPIPLTPSEINAILGFRAKQNEILN